MTDEYATLPRRLPRWRDDVQAYTLYGDDGHPSLHIDEVYGEGYGANFPAMASGSSRASDAV